MPAPSVTRRPVTHTHRGPSDDEIAVEEPLEIRVAGETLGVTLRTPGDDHALTAGFLFAEGVVRGADELGGIVHCGRTDDEGFGNVVEVTPAPGAHLVLKRLDATRRATVTTSACGLCGRATIDDLVALCGPVPEGPPIDRQLVAAGPARLREAQAAFSRTGAVHGALLVDAAGTTLGAGEDVGRHNAVDKAVGRWVLDGKRSAPELLVVSGRAGFDVVQKAAMARVRCVVSVSAATSLAIDLAERLGLVLVGFHRNGAWTTYTHPARLGG